MQPIKNLALLGVYMLFFFSSFAQVNDNVYVSGVRPDRIGTISQNIKSAKEASVLFQPFSKA